MRPINFRVAGAVLLACAAAFVALAQTGGHGFDASRMDTTVSACTDFYQFANGNWLKATQIPAAFSSWGSFDILQENNRSVLRQILEDAAKDASAAPGSNEQKIGDFYGSCMDKQIRESLGAKPIEPELASIEQVKDLKGLEAEVARLHRDGTDAVFGFGSLPDFKNSSVVMAIAGQGGLSLPNKDYYTKTDERSVKLREQFVQHVTNMFKLLGDDADRAAAEAKAVMSVENRLAQISRTPVELRDVTKLYNMTDVSKLGALTPHFSWADYFKGIGAPALAQIDVAQPEYFQGLDKMLTEVPLADWKSYLRWRVLDDAAPALSSQFDNEHFNFYGKTLQGRKEQQPQWRRCVSATDANLGEALGPVYVAKAFTPEDKARMKAMVANLIAAFREHLQKADWMSDATRKQATAKLDAFTQKIGYPDKWRDYSSLQITRDSYIENLRRASAFEVARSLNKIGKPVDRTEWGMTPPTVNAYNNSLYNEIVFPAGILQPPFFNPAADDAINYGAIGAVIGHEITHGYDDQGSNFDLHGNLSNWWTQSDRQNFDKRTDCVVKQFDAFEVEPGLHEQGKLVVGESVADLGGLNVAYDAFEKAMQGKPRTKIDGFTPEQRFFLGWAQVWAEKATPEFERLLAQSNPHPLSRFRVNAPLSNLPQFAEAFQCKAGDPMVRPEADRCQVW